jgi:hypothetical protein
MRTALVGLVLAIGCGSTQPHFADEPIVWYVDDEHDSPKPAFRKFAHIAYFTDILGPTRLVRALELRDLEPARNVNALDEVPNSTWFTNRIGVRRLTVEEMARGSVVDGPPQLPIVVTGGKTGGRNPGFMAKDATGRTFIVKLDRKANPGMQTGNDVLVSRIFWAIGYNVPQDTLFWLERSDISLAPDAEMVPKTGKRRKMTPGDLDAVLATAPRHEGGRYRAVASQFLDGVPLGGAPAAGVRADDPNDLIAHEHRRELRGLRVFAAWLSHTDSKEDNFLDMYVEVDGRHFVRHYLVDFGETLGGHEAEFDRPEDGYEFIVDWEKNGLAMLSFGFWVRPWERRRSTRWPEVGMFSADGFDPATWREAYPYWPFFEMDPSDAYWAAKIVMRFDRPAIAAIVGEARLPDDASEYLVDTLLARAQAIGRTFIESVTALDAFHIDGTELCAYDLGMVYGLAHEGVVEVMQGKRVAHVYVIGPGGRVCLPLPEGEEYTISRLRVRRGRHHRPTMQVHYKGGALPRVLGIIRSEHGPCIHGRGRPRCR